jgi:hypothetical protein
MAINITRVTTERIGPGAHGMVVAMHIESEDLPERAIPLTVKVGSVTARSVGALGIAPGVRAVFSEMPTVGAPLFIGYMDEPLEETQFKFAPPESNQTLL